MNTNRIWMRPGQPVWYYHCPGEVYAATITGPTEPCGTTRVAPIEYATGPGQKVLWRVNTLNLSPRGSEDYGAQGMPIPGVFTPVAALRMAMLNAPLGTEILCGPLKGYATRDVLRAASEVLLDAIETSDMWGGTP